MKLIYYRKVTAWTFEVGDCLLKSVAVSFGFKPDSPNLCRKKLLALLRQRYLCQITVNYSKQPQALHL
jgi:hypothetical protein